MARAIKYTEDHFQEPYEDIIKFWFGHVESTIIPSEHRARVWFGEDPEIDQQIRDRFAEDLKKAMRGEYDYWLDNPRGQLGMIILLDQFSRHIYRHDERSFAQDRKAIDICIKGIKNEVEHNLSLIERVFYYFPLLHSEDLHDQNQSLVAYNMLAELAFAETRVIYDSILKFANHHYTIVQRFGRFPQRNEVLGRESTPEELEFLKELDE